MDSLKLDSGMPVLGIKAAAHPLPSMCDCFHGGCPAGFWNSRKNRINYSLGISKWGKLGNYQSGQMGQTVNLLINFFGGSNPSFPTKFLNI